VKIFSRGRKQKHVAIQGTVETDLMKFKKRILLFLGHFNPDEAQLMLAQYNQKLVRDHFTDIFKLELECGEVLKPIIFLDEVIGPVMQLAVSSSDRATKVSACELLHCLMLYMMGSNLDDSVNSETLPLWRAMVTNAIILGCDKDPTVCQLFEPLLMQMMHFFSKPDKIMASMTSVMCECVLTMICYRGNAGIQDMSARLLREFILWLMKQSNPEQRKASPIQLVDIFRELKKMSVETDSARRMGATLAFNNIYRIVREEEALIDVYWLYLLDVFAINFK